MVSKPTMNKTKAKTDCPFSKIKTSNDLIRYEMNNYDKVVLRRSKTYWTGHDHTVWFLDKLYDISNKERKVRFDEGFGRNVRTVAFHVDNFKAIRAKMLKAGLEEVYVTRDVIAFALPEAVPVEKVKDWAYDEDSIINDVESVLYPDRLANRVAVQHFIELGSIINQAIKHDIPAELRSTLGNKMLDMTMVLLSQYTDLEIGRLSAADKSIAARRIIEGAQGLATLSMIAFNSGALGAKKGMKIGRELRGIIIFVNKKYLKEAKDAKNTKVIKNAQAKLAV